MPTNRNARSVAAALLSMVLTVVLLAACPSRERDHSTALFDTAAAAPPMAPGTVPPDALAERAMAMRASRSRVAEADAAAERERQAILAAAATRAAEQQRIAQQKLQAPRPLAPAVMDAAFWRRLANCESADGTGGNGGGYFQFSPDTARKVGYRPGLSYETQRAMAEEWLGRIGGPRNGGGRSGWPHCWWVALRG